jgi:hypothetical protein
MVRSTTRRSSAAGSAVHRRQFIPHLEARCQPIVLCFAVMDPTEVARRDQVVDMHVPLSALPAIGTDDAEPLLVVVQVMPDRRQVFPCELVHTNIAECTRTLAPAHKH